MGDLDTYRAREIGGRLIEVTNPDKVLWPEVGETKADLLDYYAQVGEHLLRHVTGRPLTVVRCPDGIDAECWYQKDLGGRLPDWVRTATLRPWEQGQDGPPDHAVLEELATLLELAQLAAVEIHAGPCPVDDLAHPAELVLDLDPPAPGHGRAVRRAARQVRALLEDELGLTTFVKASGSKGFHVHVPLDGTGDVGAVRDFARDVAERLAGRHPEELTVSQRKRGRRGRIFVDWLRNHPAQTVVAPYSVRARPQASVAVPLDWGELSEGIAPDRHTIRSVPRRLAQREDPWRGMRGTAQSLAAARERLAG